MDVYRWDNSVLPLFQNQRIWLISLNTFTIYTSAAVLHSPGGFDQINDHNLDLQRARFVLYATRPKHVVLDADISLPSIAILAWHCMHALQLWHGIASIWSLRLSDLFVESA
jgi:hypothetical protein